MFQIGKTGFRISFLNGYTIEANIGPGSECSNKHERTLAMCQNREGQLICANAEVLVYKTASGEVVTLNNFPALAPLMMASDGKKVIWANAKAFYKVIELIVTLPSIVEDEPETKPEPETSGISPYGAIDMGYEP